MATIQKQIPHVYKTCLHRGIDISKTPLEVAPGSHTWLGCIEIDVDGRSKVPGLWAAGETAGGIHGGNRIGGSALSASLVFGRRAGRAAAAGVRALGTDDPPPAAIPEAERDWLAGLLARRDGPLQADVLLRCKMLAHEKLGPIRDRAACAEARAEFERTQRGVIPNMRLGDEAATSDKVRGQELESALGVRNLALLGQLLGTAALRREESRGAHYRLDFPDRDDGNWRVVTRLQMDEDGKIDFRTDPVKSHGQF
jgi:succinate dehydrogenase/fumarate reductase flavoprotein subunit